MRTPRWIASKSTISEAEAARFLIQASFGPTRAEIARVRELGYSRWLDEQMDPARTPPTLVLPHIQQILANGLAETDLTQAHRRIDDDQRCG